MGKCKVCGHWGAYFKHSFYCPVLDKKNPHITLQEELKDPCDCEYCRKHSGLKVRLDQCFREVKLNAFQKETH